MPLYEEKLINPLAVRFSQDRIWPDFQDGTRIEVSLSQIGSVPLTGSPYDVVLRPPFPPMEVIRLKQERREADGERSRDAKGRRLFGEESWFTFDNRRLYCLQQAALQLWPTVPAVVVKVLYDFPEVRCARHKFRTTSDGCSIKISLPDGQPGSLWNWQEALRAFRTAGEGSASALAAVRRDANRSSKEMLVDLPPQVVLSPGTRETTVAERFNLSASCGADAADGKVAGQQLLNLLHGWPMTNQCQLQEEATDCWGNFEGQLQEEGADGWDYFEGWGWSWGDYSKGRGRGSRGRKGGGGGSGAYWAGKGTTVADAEEGCNMKGRRRRKPKGNGRSAPAGQQEAP